MKYKKIVEMWNNEYSEDFGKWNDISEKRKIEFAFTEGVRTGYIDIAEAATKMSEKKITVK